MLYWGGGRYVISGVNFIGFTIVGAKLAYVILEVDCIGKFLCIEENLLFI
jgi:hypothetical protein